MALFRKLFYRKPPEGLLEISERIYVFDCCFTTDSWEEKNYERYLAGIVRQLQEQFVDAALLVSNFRNAEAETPISKIMSEYGMTIMDYPRHYEGCPILSMELIHHYLRSTESWLTLGPNNILLLHCERGSWPVLAFMLTALLIYRKQYSGEQRTLDMVYKQAPRELLPMLSPLNPIPSQIRYLQYVSRRNVASQWPPLDRMLNLDCIIFRLIPDFNEEGGCRPLFRIYGQDPLTNEDRNPKLLFATQKKSKAVRSYKQVESELLKIDINCCIQGDVVLECTSLHKDMEKEDIMFRIMFNTAFIRSNILMLNRDDIDTLWDTKDYFPKDFRTEVLFSDMDAAASVVAANSSCFEEEGLPMEAFAKVQEFFSHVDWLDSRLDAVQQVSAIIKQDDSSVIIRCQPAFSSSSQESPSRNGPGYEIATSSPPKLEATLACPAKPAPPLRPHPHAAAASVTQLSNVPRQTNDNKLAQSGHLPSQHIFAAPSKDNAAKSGLPPPPPPPPLPPPTLSEKSYGKAGPPPAPTPPHKLGSSMSPAAASPPPPPGPGIQSQKLQLSPSFSGAPPPSISLGKEAQKTGTVPAPPPPPPLPVIQSQKLQVSPSVPCAPPPPSNDKGAPKFGTIPAPAPPPPPPPLTRGSGNISQKQQVSSSVPCAPPPPSNVGNGASKTGTIPPPAPPSGFLNTKGRNLAYSSGPKSSQTKKLKPLHWLKLTRAVSGSLWAETQKSGLSSTAPEIDMSELENLFSASAPISDQGATGGKSKHGLGAPKSDKVQLIDYRRASNCEIMLSKVKVPTRELMGSVLSLQDSSLDIDQLENLIKFCPTKEEMELLKGYKGEVDKLGKCEQFFLELMRVPRVEAKLRVFSFKMQFSTQVSDLKKSLNIVNSAADQIRSSVKLKRIMQTVLSLGNALNQGTARGSAVGFCLDSLLKLTETRARNNKMTLMHYLCKVIAEKLPDLLDFSKDLASTEPATKVQLKCLAEEMQALNKGLEKVVQELSMSKNDGRISDEFQKNLKKFLCYAEAEVRSLALLYSSIGRSVDSLIVYFGEDPTRCPFEQVVTILLNFTRMFNQAHEENCKQLELEKKKTEKDLGSPEINNSKGIYNKNSFPSKGGKIK